MGGGENPTLVPLLDLCNHDRSGAPFTSFDTSGARVAARLSARKRRSGDTSSKSARTAVTAENWRSDGDDWCLWSWRSGTARALAAGDEIYADYAPEPPNFYIQSTREWARRARIGRGCEGRRPAGTADGDGAGGAAGGSSLRVEL